jgi:hypothetical protein
MIHPIKIRYYIHPHKSETIVFFVAGFPIEYCHMLGVNQLTPPNILLVKSHNFNEVAIISDIPIINGLVCWGKSTGNHGFYHQI